MIIEAHNASSDACTEAVLRVNAELTRSSASPSRGLAPPNRNPDVGARQGGARYVRHVVRQGWSWVAPTDPTASLQLGLKPC